MPTFKVIYRFLEEILWLIGASETKFTVCQALHIQTPLNENSFPRKPAAQSPAIYPGLRGASTVPDIQGTLP